MRKTPLIGCMLLLLGATSARAQVGQPQTRLVLGAGFSYAGGDAETRAGAGIAGHAGLTHQRGPFVLAFRAGSTRGGSTGVRVSGGGTLHDRFDEMGVLAGYAISRRPGLQTVLSAGVATVSGERVLPGRLGNRPFESRIGVPVQLDIASPDIARSFGAALYANFNAEETFGTLTVLYTIGRGTR